MCLLQAWKGLAARLQVGKLLIARQSAKGTGGALCCPGGEIIIITHDDSGILIVGESALQRKT